MEEAFREGGFGRIYKIEREDGTVAKKVAKGCKGVSCLLKEVNVFEQVGDHPHIVKFLGKAPLCLYMEWCEDGDLFHMVEKCAFKEEEALRITICLYSALTHLHGKGVCHLDVKLENILMFGTHPKLADFGLASLIGKMMYMQVGNKHFLCPESYNGCYFGEDADIWSLGVVLFSCLTQTYPFNDACENCPRFVRYTCDSSILKMDNFPKCGKVVLSLLSICPEERSFPIIQNMH